MTPLHIEHTFDVAPRAYGSIYFDEAFSIELCEALHIGRELLLLERTGSRVVRHVRCAPVRDLPGPVAKLLQGQAFHYREEIDFDLNALRGTWRVVPGIFADKVDASGTLDFLDAGGDRVTRVVKGGVDLRLFGIGALVERFVVAEVVRSYEDAAKRTREILARRAERG